MFLKIRTLCLPSITTKIAGNTFFLFFIEVIDSEDLISVFVLALKF